MPEIVTRCIRMKKFRLPSKPIVGVSTSTPAFVGIVKDPIQIPEDIPTSILQSPSMPNNLRYRTWIFSPPRMGTTTRPSKAFEDAAPAGRQTTPPKRQNSRRI